VRWVDDEPHPGLVEVVFTEADGQRRKLVDKVAVFDDANRIRPQGPFPVSVDVRCEVISEASVRGTQVVTISTARPWGLETPDGQSEFQVLPQQLTHG
jgi:hypothetical protein